ncbi:MAG: C-type lectin domain-containing protein [Lachnospiraceae bacterium]|nr:C-type lectin domain-containing protein [Robinsoniella sp.]MDY3765749.1 C-type lectin domain-containing protein [Lachnospiraceae bacterium]
MKNFSRAIVAFSFFLAHSLAVSAESFSAPESAVEYGGHFYQLYLLHMDWEEAEAFLERHGGHLATITSQEENDFLYEYLSSFGYTSAFFGATDQEQEGIWEWVTGEPFSYSNWHANEPNNQDGTEHYAMFYSTYLDGTWNDGQVNVPPVSIPFLCEWDTGGEESDPVLTAWDIMDDEPDSSTVAKTESVADTAAAFDDRADDSYDIPDDSKDVNYYSLLHIDTLYLDFNLFSLEVLGIFGAVFCFLAALISKIKKKGAAKRKAKAAQTTSRRRRRR